MMLAGANPAIMWALMGLLQTFYYMIFINVEYPANVIPFFKLFSMGSLNFLPNPTAWFFPDIEDESLDAPQKFLDNDVDGLFLQTGGEMLLTWFVVIVGYGLSLFLLKYTRNMPRILTGAASKTVEIFEWSGVFRTLITSYTQLAIAAFLQVRVLNYTSFLFGLSSICGILFVVFTALMPVLTWYVIHKHRRSPKIMQKKFGTLIEELKTDPKVIIPKYINFLFLIRRLVLAMTLVFLYDYPYVEVTMLILNYLGWTVLLCIYMPYESKLNNVVNITTEVIFTGVHVVIFLLVHDDTVQAFSDDLRLTLGWVIIGSCGVILVVTLVASFVQQFETMKELFLLVKKLLTKKGREELKMSMSSGLKKKELKIIKGDSGGGEFKKKELMMTSMQKTQSISSSSGVDIEIEPLELKGTSSSSKVYPVKSSETTWSLWSQKDQKELRGQKREKKVEFVSRSGETSSVMELKNGNNTEFQFDNSLDLSKWTLESLPKRNKKV